jgi:SulP family sulfate permease
LILALAILAIVEALSIAKSIASSSGERINGNQEFIGQGLANLFGGFFSAIPGTGSFTRSAVNFKSGAKTRFAGVYSGLIIALIVLFFAPLAKFIPIPSLAGILMVIAYTMIDQKSLKMSFRATTADKIVLLATFFSTIFLELEKAVFIGVIISIILFLKKVSRPQIYRMYPQSHDNKLRPIDKDARECPQIAIYEIQGPLFFGAISELEDQLYSLDHRHFKAIIIRMKYIQLLDATGAHAFEKLLEDLKTRKIKLILTGVNPGVLRVFKRTGIFQKIGEENITPDTTWALHYTINNYIDLKKCAVCESKVFKECSRLTK